MLICDCPNGVYDKINSYCKLHRCQDSVSSGGTWGWLHPHRCKRKATGIDSYGYGVCTVHNPVIRKAKSDAKWEAYCKASDLKFATGERNRQIAKYKDEIIDHLKHGVGYQNASVVVQKMINALTDLENKPLEDFMSK